MSSPEKRPSGPEYIVRFNSEIAWTITYGDSFGRLVFVFEPGETPRAISLDPIPLENNRVVRAPDAATRSRLDLALQRTRAFLVACGYDVEVQANGRARKEHGNMNQI
jgi:hypothetical protein